MREFGPFCILLLAVGPSWGASRLTLKEAEELALRQHPHLRAMQANEDAMREKEPQIKSGLRPQVTMAATGALSEDDNTRILAGGINNPLVLNRFGVGFGVSQLLTDFGRTGYLAEAARWQTRAAGEEKAAARAQVLLEVDRAYFAALGAQAVLRVASETVKTRQVLAERAELLAANKLKSGLDATFARVDLQEARLLEANALNEARSAMVELSNALGLPAPGEFELADEPMPESLPAGWEQVARDALENRPELKQAQWDEKAAESFVKADRTLSFPTVRFVAGTGYAPVHAERVQNHWNTGGITVELPFLNGGLFAARRREAEARERAAKAAAQEMANRVARDVRLAYVRAENAFDRLKLTASLVDEARQAFALAKARYDLGLSSIVEVSQAQLNSTRAEIAQASAKFEYQAACATLAFERGVL